MPEHHLDEHIRKKLSTYQAPYTSGDWSLMAAALDQAEWDSRIRGKLKDIQVPYNHADWKLMSSQLDAPFDTYVRKQLMYFTAHYNPADWARMAQLLDDSLESSIRARLETHEVPFRPVSDWPLMADALDSTFDDAIRDKFSGFAAESEMEEGWANLASALASPADQVIREKLDTFEASYHPMEWMLMEAKLDAAEDDDGVAWYFRWQNYALVASFMLLALLTIGGLQLLSDQLSEGAAISSGETVEYSNEAITSPEASENGVVDYVASSQESTPLGIDEPELASNQQASLAETDEIAGASLTEENQASVAFAVDETPGQLNPIDHGPDQIELALTSLPEVGQVGGSNPTDLVSEKQMPADRKNRPRLMADRRKNQDIALTTISRDEQQFGLGFVQAGLDELLGKNAPSMSSSVNLRNPQIRLGVYGASTHSVAELNDPSKPGYAVGLRAEIRFDEDWSIVSGLAYTHKQLSHNYYIFADDRTQWENILDAKINSLEVPVLVRYRFPATPQQKVRLYAQAGIATMVTLEENYLRYNPLSFENADRVSRNVDRTQHIPTNQRFTLNTYVGNIQAAAGLEYKVSDRLSVEVEPYFQWGLQPISTEQKRLHSVGIGGAMIYNLSNKSS